MMRHSFLTLLKFTPFLVLQFGFDFGGLASILEGYLSAVLSFIFQVVLFIWNVLVYVAQYIWSALNFVGNFFYQLAQDIKKAFGWIWNTVIKSVLTKIVDVIVKVRTWLNKIFGPLVRWLLKVRKWIDWAFNKYVKPVLVLIQHIRQVLTIFRLLGFKWAARLDALLAKIQQDIVKAYTLLRSELNKVITYLDLIVDPGAILRRNPLFAALIRSAAELRNLELQVVTRPLTPDESDKQARDRSQATADGQKANFTTYYSQGNLTPDDDAARKQFTDEWNQLRAAQDDYSV